MTRRRKPTFWTADDAAADRAARYGGGGSGPRPAGILATFDGFCWTCDRAIVRHETTVLPRKGGWVCADCAGGGE